MAGFGDVKLAERQASQPSAPARVMPDYGHVTWESEGHEGGPYHSRRLHVPSDSSGLTIGRGYDMGSKNAGTIYSDLTKAGVSESDAKTISKAAGLRGEKARRFIAENGLGSFEISLEAQKILFDSTYAAEASEVKRICTKADVKAKYGDTDWSNLDPAIRDMLVDLKFRGDYTPSAREKIQTSVVSNDFEAFAKLLLNRENWKNVPKDRFERRSKFLQGVLDARKKATPTPIPSPSIPRPR